MVTTLKNQKVEIKEQLDERILGRGNFVGELLKKIEIEGKEERKIKKSINWEDLINKIVFYCKITINELMGESRSLTL